MTEYRHLLSRWCRWSTAVDRWSWVISGASSAVVDCSSPALERSCRQRRRVAAWHATTEIGPIRSAVRHAQWHIISEYTSAPMCGVCEWNWPKFGLWTRPGSDLIAKTKSPPPLLKAEAFFLESTFVRFDATQFPLQIRSFPQVDSVDRLSGGFTSHPKHRIGRLGDALPSQTLS